jgi:DNA uptake protein ComE-like DNA-binding protein
MRVNGFKGEAAMNSIRSVRLVLGLCVGLGGSVLFSAEEKKQREAKRAAPSVTDAEGRLDLNTADLKTLEAVPVIGPEVARAIVAARPFTTVDELDRLKGISAERLEQIRAKVTVATLHVPSKVGMPTVAATQRGPGEDPGNKIDLNTADLRTLEAIPTIGPEVAAAIIAARPFTTLDDLSRVKGLSAEQMEAIRTSVIVRPATPKNKKDAAADSKPLL